MCSWRKEYKISAPTLEHGQAALNAETIIQFALYIAEMGIGNIDKKMTSVRTCVTAIERFFAGAGSGYGVYLV